MATPDTEILIEQAKENINQLVKESKQWQNIRLLYIAIIAPLFIGNSVHGIITNTGSLYLHIIGLAATIGCMIYISIGYYRDSRRLFEMRLHISMLDAAHRVHKTMLEFMQAQHEAALDELKGTVLTTENASPSKPETT